MEVLIGSGGKQSQLSPRRSLSRDFYLALTAVLLVAAATFGLLFYLRWTTPPDEETYVPRPEAITPEIELLRRYVRLDTSNPPGSEIVAARFLLGELQDAGLSAELIESAPGRANVYARIRGNTPGQGLMLLHHIDVVPADPRGWKHPPFEGAIFQNEMWGRGTLDMKGIGICHLRAFLQAARSGRRPERDLVFLATADEEQGGELGVAWLLKNRPEVFAGIRYALNEGGIPEMKAEQLTYFGIEIGTKLFMRARLRSRSRGDLEQARIALEPYWAPFDPERIIPEVKKFFESVAPHRIRSRELLTDIDAAMDAGNFWLLDDSYRTLTQNNLIPLGIRRSDAGFSMDVILSNLPDEDPARRLEHLSRLVAPFNVEVEVTEAMDRSAFSSPDSPFFRLLVACVQKVYGAGTAVGPLILAHQANDSRYLRSQGIQSYGFSPFLLTYHQSQGIHAEDERLRLDWFVRGVELTEEIVLRYCGLGQKASPASVTNSLSPPQPSP